MYGRIAVAVVTAIVLFLHYSYCIATPIKQQFSISKPGVPGQYPYVKPLTRPWNPPHPKDVYLEWYIERLIVKVRLENEDDSWLDSLLPVWQKQVITIDRAASNMHEGGNDVDKGRIASAYLSWIIENYNNLPETTVFLRPQLKHSRHDHEALTLDEPSGSGNWKRDIHALQVPFIRSNGFANLRCPSQSQCADPFRSPSHHFRTLDQSLLRSWEGIFGDAPLPDKLAAPPTADFAVSRAQVQKRSVDEYLKFWTWLNKTVIDDETAGRVMESIWHVIFGQDPTFCVEQKKCQCDVYGDCEEAVAKGLQ